MARKARNTQRKPGATATAEYAVHQVCSTTALAGILVMYPGCQVYTVAEGFPHEGCIEVHKDGKTLAYISLTGV